MKKKPLIILTGPTAVGKTKASIGLAKAVDGEIISADSMQVYRHMDIGSAKIKPEEMEGIPHHLIDVLEPDDEFHVVKFQQLAKKAMREIWERGHIPIVTGGTGFYIQALLYDIDFDENEKEDACRKELEAYAREHGAEALHEKLALVDPASAEMIHPNNIKRVIRALEFYEQTGKRISEHNETQRQRESPYSIVFPNFSTSGRIPIFSYIFVISDMFLSSHYIYYFFSAFHGSFESISSKICSAS